MGQLDHESVMEDGVLKMVKGIKVNKAVGEDGIVPAIIRNSRSEVIRRCLETWKTE